MKRTLLLLLFSYSFKSYCQDTLLIPTKKLDIRNGCYDAKNNGLMKSAEELKSNIFIPNYSRNSSQCKSYSLPDFNFLTNDLIWFDLSIGNAFQKDVTTYLYKIPSQRKYLLLIKVVGDGNNTMAANNIVLIKELTKKLEAHYTFEYKIQNVYK